jgi:hypothetical protein
MGVMKGIRHKAQGKRQKAKGKRQKAKGIFWIINLSSDSEWFFPLIL